MIGELLKLHDIKHVISVDDCYLRPDEDEMKAVLYSEMQESFDVFEDSIKTMGMENALEETKEMIEINGDSSLLLKRFLESFSAEQLMKLYESSATLKQNNYIEEKRRIIEFLNYLKEKEYIESFEVFPSTKVALDSDYIRNAQETEGVLWLIDQNFNRVGESEKAGLELAKTIVERTEGPTNYVYILSSMQEDKDKDDDDIEKDFDSFLRSDYDKKESSFIYYIYKQRIIPQKPDKVAKGLAQGFKRKACYELFDLYTSSMRDSVADSSEKICNIRQDTLNYLLDEMVKENGESYLEFLNRFVGIFQMNSYQKLLADKYKKIVEKVQYYKKVSDIVMIQAVDKQKKTEKVKEFREIELYNYYVNRQHCEISTGDIFKINGQYYFLASQPCDTCLRGDGSRVLREATLLQICDDSKTQYFVHRLSCFESYSSPIINYRSQLVFPFEILDLCVLNEDGRAALPINITETLFDLYTDRYANRIKLIAPEFYRILNDSQTLEDFFSDDVKSCVDKEKARMAYENNKEVRPELLRLKEKEETIEYEVQRICRLDELLSVDIVNEFGINLSRIGHAFDYTKRTQRNKSK